MQAEEHDEPRRSRGLCNNQDLRRVPQAVIEVKNQEGDIVSSGVSNDAGEFKVSVPEGGTYSVSAVQETYRSEYVVLTLGEEPPKPVTLTLSKTKEVALEVVVAAAAHPDESVERNLFTQPKGNRHPAAREQYQSGRSAIDDSERRVWVVETSPHPSGPCQSAAAHRWSADSGYSIIHIFGCDYAPSVGARRYRAGRDGGECRK